MAPSDVQLNDIEAASPEADFYDANMKASDGCEAYCQKTNGGVEICDGRDNDCNGLVDDNVAPPTIVCRSQGSVCGK